MRYKVGKNKITFKLLYDIFSNNVISIVKQMKKNSGMFIIYMNLWMLTFQSTKKNLKWNYFKHWPFCFKVVLYNDVVGKSNLIIKETKKDWPHIKLLYKTQ